MKVWIDRDKCIGAAPCIAIVPNVFELDDEGKAVVKEEAIKESDGEKHYIKGELADDATLKMGAEACPVQAVYLYDDDGNQIYPPLG